MSDEKNRWYSDETAQAFWDQHRALPYQDLLRDTVDWCQPMADETWLDLGCGGGFLTANLWKASKGKLSRILATDCAAANHVAIERLQRKLEPAPAQDQLQFAVLDFSKGMATLEDNSFDGIVSGLAISYAESFDLATQRFTDAAYNRVYHEMFRVLKPGGKLVFSVNVPEPDFWKIVWRSIGKGVRFGKPLKTLKNVISMQRHGAWLKREARRGRFHFVPLVGILQRLQAAGFENWSSKLSYADQAYVVRAYKPHRSVLTHVA